MSPIDAMRWQLLMDAARGKKLKAAEDIYSFAYRDDARAILIEPVNGDPFIVQGAYDAARNARFDAFMSTTFESTPKSGTDRLRKRMLAGLHFQAIKAQKRAPMDL